MHNFFIWIATAIGSLFGIHSPAITPPPSIPVQTQASQLTIDSSVPHTNQWQTYSYSDSQNNFSIQYPTGYTVVDLKPKQANGDHTIIFKSADATQTKPISLSVETWLAESNRNAKAQITQFSNPTYGAGLKKSTVSIGSIPAVEFTTTTDPAMKGSFIIFDKGQYTYTLSSMNVDQKIYQEFYNSLSLN